MASKSKKNVDQKVTLDELAEQRDGLSRLPRTISNCWDSINSIEGHLTFHYHGESLFIEGQLKIPKKAIFGLVILIYLATTKGQFAHYLANIF